MIIIRNETQQDYKKIYKFVQEAFKTAKMSDGHEQDFVSALQKSERYLQDYSFLLEKDNQLIGHIMLSRAEIKNEEREQAVLLLAPLSIRKDERSNGYGGLLIRTVIQEIQLQGDDTYSHIVVVGDPDYYTKFGFKDISNYPEVQSISGIPDRNVMILPLSENVKLNGAIIY